MIIKRGQLRYFNRRNTVLSFKNYQGPNLIKYLIQFISNEDVDFINKDTLFRCLSKNILSINSFFFVISNHYVKNKNKKTFLNSDLPIYQPYNDDNNKIIYLLNSFLSRSKGRNSKFLLKLFSFYFSHKY